MLRVIVVEDDPMNAMLLERILRLRGHLDVMITEDAETLLAEAARNAALVIMDVSLSNTYYHDMKIDGPDLVRLMREDPRTARVPVILATAHAMHGDREELLRRSGANGYVSKPIVDQDAFMAQVMTLIEQTTHEKETRITP